MYFFWPFSLLWKRRILGTKNKPSFFYSFFSYNSASNYSSSYFPFTTFYSMFFFLLSEMYLLFWISIVDDLIGYLSLDYIFGRFVGNFSWLKGWSKSFLSYSLLNSLMLFASFKYLLAPKFGLLSFFGKLEVNEVKGVFGGLCSKDDIIISFLFISVVLSSNFSFFYSLEKLSCVNGTLKLFFFLLGDFVLSFICVSLSWLCSASSIWERIKFPSEKYNLSAILNNYAYFFIFCSSWTGYILV